MYTLAPSEDWEGEVMGFNSLLNLDVPIFTLVNRDTVILAIYG